MLMELKHLNFSNLHNLNREALKKFGRVISSPLQYFPLLSEERLEVISCSFRIL